MNKGNATIISIIALALVVALGVIYFGSTAQRGEKGDKGDSGLTVTGPQGPKGSPGENGEVDFATLKSLQNVLYSLSDVVGKLPKSKLGSVVGPDFSGPYWGVNDVAEFRSRQVMLQATSTVCSIVSPSATSTLIAGTVSFSVATTGVANLTFDIAKDSPVTRTTGQSTVVGGGGFATTTLLGAAALTVAPSTSGTFFASTTAGNAIFGPNEFFVVKAANGNPTTCASNCALHNNAAGFVPVGTCNAVWIATERLNR